MIPISNRERDNNNNTRKKKAQERNLTHPYISLSYNVKFSFKLYLMNGS